MIKLSQKRKDQLIGGGITIMVLIAGNIVKKFFSKPSETNTRIFNSNKSFPQSPTINALNKDSAKQTITQVSQNNSNRGNVNNDFISGDKKIRNVYVHSKATQKDDISNSQALIITKNQSGGQNTVNYSGEKFNPANITKRPIFDTVGYYGPNILNERIKNVSKDTSYSFSAKIPVNSRLRVTLQAVGEGSKPFWFIRWGAKNWRNNYYDQTPGWTQKFDLDEEVGDLNIYFRDHGKVKMEIFYNDSLISEKIINCQ